MSHHCLDFILFLFVRVQFSALNVYFIIYKFDHVLRQNVSRGSSVSIMSGYGLEDRAIKVRSPAEVKDFSSSLCVQTGSGPTQPPVQWVPGLKRGRGVTLTTHPHLLPRSRMSRSYTSSLPSAFMACGGKAVAFNYDKT
jgi:hypothetical protein